MKKALSAVQTEPFLPFLLTVTAAIAVTATVFTARVSFVAVVMIALGIRIKLQPSFQKRLHRRVRITVYPCVQTDPRLHQRGLCACSDAAADEHLHIIGRQKTC